MKLFWCLLPAVVILIVSCGGTKAPENTSAEQVFEKGKALFDEEDFLDAKQHLELIQLQYPASQLADDAQYYLAEINYKREEFILAAFSYSRLRRIYPGSQYSKESLFKNALCYYNLSPSYDRDQEYTNKAIEAFQEFQYLYPEDSLYHESSKKIAELREKLAHREFFTAELYRKMDSPRSALVYYDAVINHYNDTKFLEDAFIGKIEALYYMKRYDQAISLIRAFTSKFPGSKHETRVNQIFKEIGAITGD